MFGIRNILCLVSEMTSFLISKSQSRLGIRNSLCLVSEMTSFFESEMTLSLTDRPHVCVQFNISLRQGWAINSSGAT